MIVVCILVMLMMPSTEAAGGDNNSTITIIIAAAAAVVVITIIIAIVIGCMYYSRAVKVINAKVKKQIINSTEKRTIYRPEKMSLDAYFKAYEDEENTVFFQKEMADISDERVVATEDAEVEMLEGDFRKITENERQGTVEDLQLHEENYLYQEKELTDFEVGQDIYGEISYMEESIAERKNPVEDTIESNDTTTCKNEESTEEILPIQQVLIPSSDGKHKVFKKKLMSHGFLSAEHLPVSKDKKKNYNRWKMLSLERKTKHETAARNLKSDSRRHRVFGYFRKPVKSKVSKLRINKITKKNKPHLSKVNAVNDVPGVKVDYVKEKSVLDHEGLKTLIADEYDKKDIKEDAESQVLDTEIGSDNKDSENSTGFSPQITAHLDAQNDEAISVTVQKQQDKMHAQFVDSETETENKKPETPEKKPIYVDGSNSKPVYDQGRAAEHKIKQTNLQSSNVRKRNRQYNKVFKRRLLENRVSLKKRK